MAHIPYGYKIQGGLAVIEKSEAGKVRAFFDHYLSGMSIRDAGALAGVPRSQYGLRKLLSNPVYAGDDYYPGIVSQEVFDQAQLLRQERAKNNHPVSGRRGHQAVPVFTRFRMAEGPEPEVDEDEDPVARAAAVYRRIIPVTDDE